MLQLNDPRDSTTGIKIIRIWIKIRFFKSNSILEGISWTKLDHHKIEQENGSMLEDISCPLDNYTKPKT